MYFYPPFDDSSKGTASHPRNEPNTQSSAQSTTRIDGGHAPESFSTTHASQNITEAVNYKPRNKGGDQALFCHDFFTSKRAAAVQEAVSRERAQTMMMAYELSDSKETSLNRTPQFPQPVKLAPTSCTTGVVFNGLVDMKQQQAQRTTSRNGNTTTRASKKKQKVETKAKTTTTKATLTHRRHHRRQPLKQIQGPNQSSTVVGKKSDHVSAKQQQGLQVAIPASPAATVAETPTPGYLATNGKEYTFPPNMC